MKRILSLLLTLSLLTSFISIPVMATETISGFVSLQTINNLNVEEVISEAQMKKQDIVEDQNIIKKEQLEQEAEEAVEIYEDIEASIKEEPTTSNIAITSFSTKITRQYLMSTLSIGAITQTSNGNFQVAIANANGSFTNKGNPYTDFVQAKSAMNANIDANAVVLDTRRIIGNQVVAMKDGVVVITANKVGKSVMTFNFASDERISTYVENSIDALYYDSTGSTIKMGISGQIVQGIKIEEVELVPMSQGKQSYYSKNSNGDLIHSVARYTINQTTNRYTGNYESITISKAPSFMTAGVKYYSADGEQFYKDNKLKNLAGKFYPYFKYLSFRSKTLYTAEELNYYIASWNKSNSTLNGKGAAFIKAQDDFGVNAALLLAFAVHESGYGTSTIARDKNNLFGVNATDENPYGNANVFNSIEACIYNQAEYQISRGYADANTDGRYFGVNLGNKTVGLNVKYASDPYWGEKIAGHMYRLDKLLGNKDNNKYQIAVSNKITYAKKQASGSSANYYQYSVKNYSIPKGMPVVVTNSSNGWYKVQSDMGIDSKGTTPASYSTQYDYTLSKAYVSTADFTLVNDPTIKYLDPATQGSNQAPEPEPEPEPTPEPEPEPTPEPTPEPQDTIAPSIVAKSDSTSLTNGAMTKLDTTITITDESTYTKIVTKNGSTTPWPSNSTFTGDGEYTITATDAKGNKSILTFTIDKTKPNIIVKSTTGTSYTNGKFINTDVKVTYTEPNYLNKAMTKDGKSIAWPTDSIVKTDGKYIVTVKDKAQNTAEFTFTIDKTKPKINVKSTTGTTYTNGKFINTNVKVTYTEPNYLSKAITKDGKSITWSSDNIFKTDGKYVATVKDKSGNTSTFTFTIDKTKPIVTVKTTGGFNIRPGQTTKHNVKATYFDKNYSSKTVTRNGKSYKWPLQDIFKLVGTYEITVKDKAGNVTTYKFYYR